MSQAALPKGENTEPQFYKQKKLYSYLQALLMSFFSVDIYVDVRHRWKGFGALYLLSTVAILTVPLALFVGLDKYNYYNDVLMPSLKKLPSMEVIKGELQFNKKSPFFINNPKTNKPIIIIDTSGKITELNNKSYPSASLLITKYSMVSRFEDTPATMEKFAKELNGKISQQSIIPMFENLKFIVFNALYPSLTMLLYGMLLSIIAILAFIMKVFARILLKYKINFKQSMRIACVSSTPMITLFIISTMFQLHGKPMQWIMFFCFWGYYIFAIRSNKFAARHPLIV